MPDNLYVKPSAPDLGLRDPVTKAPLPEEGGCVPDTPFWRRRIKNEDVVVLPEEEHAAALARTHAAARAGAPAEPAAAVQLSCVLDGRTLEVDADMLQLLVNENTDLREQVKHTTDALRAGLEAKEAENTQLRGELDSATAAVTAKDAELAELRVELDAATAPAKPSKSRKKGG